MDKELKRRQHVLDKLYKEASDLEADHSKWMHINMNKKDTEMQNRLKIMEKEKEHMRNVQRIEEEISRQRVESMWNVEKAAKEELEALDYAAKQAQEYCLQQEEHLKSKLNLALNIQKHRELAENTSAATEERLRVLHLRRTRDTFIKNIQDRYKEKKLKLIVKIKY